MKQALEQAGPVLLEPIMLVTVTAPEDAVGDVIGDLNSRRGRPLGMEPVGRRDDRDQGRGADGRDALLRARPALDHRRPGRVHDGVRCATRRCPGTSPARSSTRRAPSGRRSRPERSAVASSRCWRRWYARCVSTRDIQHLDRARRRATSAGARCCAASAPRSTSAAATAARCASCARRGRCTRAGCARARSPITTTRAPVDRRRSLLGRLRAAAASAEHRTRSRRPRARARGRRLRRARRPAPSRRGRPGRRRAPRPPGAAQPAARAAARARRPDQHRAQDLLGGRAVQRLRAPAHGGRRSPARSGCPTVVGAARRPSAPSVVNVVVSWELCWYRYEVDLSDEVASVRACRPGLRARRARRPSERQPQRRRRRAAATLRLRG